MAYESTTLTAIRREIGTDLGLMKYGNVTALTTTSLSVPSLLLNTNRAGSQLDGETILSRPDATTAADNKRYASTVTTSSGLILTAGGANYADTTATSEVAEFWFHNIDPYVDVLDLINRTLDYQPVKTFYLLSSAIADSDYDMQGSATTAFTSVVTPTLSKVTTARRVRFGRRSLRVLSSGADEGVITPTVPHVEGAQFKCFVFVSSDVGGASIQAYDITNSAAIGSAVVSTEEAMMLTVLEWQAPDATANPDCLEVAIRMLGTTTTADNYYNGAAIVQRDNLFMDFPLAISEKFKAPSVFQARPTGNSQTSNLYPAHSIEMVELIAGQDFRYRFHHPDANPYGIILSSTEYLDWPIFLEAEIPASDLGTFAAETDTTTAPANQFVPRCELRMIDHLLIPRFGATEKLVGLRAIAAERLKNATIVRLTEPVARRRGHWGGPYGGRL